MNSDKDKVFCIFRSSTDKNDEWKSQIDEWCEKYIMFNKKDNDVVLYYEKYEDVIFSDEKLNNKQIVTFGYDLSSDIMNFMKIAKELKMNCCVIENLCCDVNVTSHRKAVDYLRINGYSVKRDYEFLRTEIDNVIRTSLEKSSGRPSNFDENTPMHYLGYDSLDITNLVFELEDYYNVYIEKGYFGKLWKYKEIPNILAKYGQLSDLYKNK